MITKIQKHTPWVSKMTRKEAEDIMDQGHEIIVVRKLGIPEPYVLFRCHKTENRYFGVEFYNNSETPSVEQSLSTPATRYHGGMTMSGWWGFFSQCTVSEHSVVTKGQLEYFVNYKKGLVKPKDTKDTQNRSNLMPLLRDF